MEQLAFVILPIWLFLIAGWILRDTGEYETFKGLCATKDRQAFFRKWILHSFLLFGCGSLLSLLLTGHIGALLQPLPEIANLIPRSNNVEETGISGDDVSGFAIGFLLGGTGVIGVLIGLTILNRRKKNPQREMIIVGDVHALLPRNSRERFYAVLLSLNAGFSEELFFRLLLPILIVLVTGNAILAVVSSVLIFGAVHWYQGWVGVVATTAIGAIMMAIYLFTGMIWLVIILHALIDLNGLILMPALQRRRGKRSKVDSDKNQ